MLRRSADNGRRRAAIALTAPVVMWLGVNLVRSPSAFASLTLIGLTIGFLYAVIALGFTLVYGILETINFAHGDVFILGSMLSASIARHAHLSADDRLPSMLGKL